MPVLEVTCLRAMRLAVNDPKVLESLSVVRGKLQTSSQFYGCIEDPTAIYILGIWPDLDSHLAFLSSPLRDEVLSPQEDILHFEWTVHMELDSMHSLPLDYPVLAIERIGVGVQHVETFHQAAARHAQRLECSHDNRPLKVAQGWRIDAPLGSHEAVIFTGSDTVQAHVTFAAWQNGLSDGDPLAIDGRQYEELVCRHGINLERVEAQRLNLA